MKSFYRAAADHLLREFGDAGFCEGRLSSSALSTALAAFALSSGHPSADEERVNLACDWLLQTQNEDGGWGDSPDSPSNRTTTLIAWAVLGRLGAFTPPAHRSVVHWLEQDFGSDKEAKAAGLLFKGSASATTVPANDLKKAHLSLRKKVLSDYGSDKTFSIPILTLLALTGVLPWRLVPQLPFELAVIPQRLFRWARLPVVSYALPALIAVGLVRHRQRPTRLFPWRWLRHMCVTGVLRRLETIQPAAGGFLEAAPLTAFVIMSLTGAGEENSPVAAKGRQFLRTTQRTDGSWPIDTHLATWVTSLAVDALAAANVSVPEETATKMRRYLLSAQHKMRHAFTGAAPGGWAWTHLSGGVPDADDTAAALIALRHLHRTSLLSPQDIQSVRQGILWLSKLQNRDGGIPTFCRGWGRFPFDRSCPDITAHALRAFHGWAELLPEQRPAMERSMTKALTFLVKTQNEDGSWRPLWFGNQHVSDFSNPVYGTAQVIITLGALEGEMVDLNDCLKRACEYLTGARNPDGGWGGAAGIPSSIEETAVTVRALINCAGDKTVIAAGMGWLESTSQNGQIFPSSPIGLYFARLWYAESLYPVIHAAACRSESFTVAEKQKACR